MATEPESPKRSLDAMQALGDQCLRTNFSQFKAAHLNSRSEKPVVGSRRKYLPFLRLEAYTFPCGRCSLRTQVPNVKETKVADAPKLRAYWSREAGFRIVTMPRADIDALSSHSK